jgi:hypothetical protein
MCPFKSEITNRLENVAKVELPLKFLFRKFMNRAEENHEKGVIIIRKKSVKTIGIVKNGHLQSFLCLD